MIKKQVNTKVVVQSLLALTCFALGFVISYWFFLLVAYFLWSNQKELYKK